MQYFNIQVASQLSGVASATIRAWEKRYNAVVPERAENKHRLYSETDIEKLAVLFKLTELGQSIGKVAHLELEALKEVYTRLLHRPYDERQLVTPNHEKIDSDKMLTSFYLALSTYKLDIISHELEKAKAVLTPRALCLEVLVPLFHEIGLKVARGEISIAQEHTLNAIVRFHLGQVIGQHYQQNHITEDVILITTPEGDHHELGILGSALRCVHYGFKFIFLGPNLPAPSLAEAANSLNAKILLIGSTRYELSTKMNLDDYLNFLRTQLNHSPHIWIGGNAKPNQCESAEKNSMPFFPTLQALDEHLEIFNRTYKQ